MDSGLDQIRLRYNTPFEVEADFTLDDGKPAAFRMKPLKPMALIARGLSWPVMSDKRNNDGADSGDQKRNARLIQNIVAYSIVAGRDPIKNGDAWEDRWTEIDVITQGSVNPKASPRQFHIEEFDIGETLTLMWNELMRRFQLQQRVNGAGRNRNRAEGISASRDAGGNVGDASARASARPERRANVSHSKG